MSLTLKKDRHIAPKWRPLDQTIENGELNGITSPVISTEWSYPSYDKGLQEWKNKPSLSTAAELLQICSTNRLPVNDEVMNACEFILRNSAGHEFSILRSHAEGILGLDKDKSKSKNKDSYIFSKDGLIGSLYRSARDARERLSRNPRNAIAHLDLGRTYMCLGLHEKALKEIRDAVFLAPDARYITRSAIKGHLHVMDVDGARDVLRKNYYRNDDPWLLSASMAIDLARDSSVKTDVRKVKGFINNDSVSMRSVSELAATFATLESRSSKIKEVRRLLKKSLIEPIDNSLAQALWLNSSENLRLEFQNRDYLFGYEYLTFKYEEEKDYDEALKQAFLWVQDEPFSSRAILEYSNLLSIYFNRYEDAIEALKFGLLANPNAHDILNNVIYSYIELHDYTSAEKYFRQLSEAKSIKLDSLICLTATHGLLAYRMNESSVGGQLYNRAIELARKYKRKKYVESARLNYLREQYLAGQISKEELDNRLAQVTVSCEENQRLKDKVSQYLKNKWNR